MFLFNFSFFSIELTQFILDVDYVIALTHQDIALDRNTAAREEIDLILGGHDHTPYIEKYTNAKQKDCWIVKVGKDATNVQFKNEID
jgi:2',3'-cyclic-nucleotide 2'-phosphodiesterase (5'-nucleotidase family)